MRFLRSPLFWLGLLVSLATLFFALRGLHWGEVADASREADYLFLLPAAVVMFVSLYFRAIRWAVLFHPVTHVRLGALMGAMNVGYSVNNLLPLRVGELVRAYLIGEAQKVSTAHALSTIVVERVLDVLTVVLMLVLLLPFINVPAWATVPAVAAGTVFLLLAAALATPSLARHWALGMVDWVSRPLPAPYQARSRRAAEWVMEGFSVLSKPTVLAQGIFWSFAAWSSSALMMFIVQRAFDLGLGFEAGPFVLATTSLAMLVPASPGYIGTFELAVIKGLEGVFDVESNTAASYALVQHAFLFVAPMIIAAVYLWRERQAWQQMRFWARRTVLAEDAAGAGVSVGPSQTP